MGESHAYGTSCGCLSRRMFVLGFSIFLAAVCYLQIGRWLLESRIFDLLFGFSRQREHVRSCTGTECYDVFTCRGLKDTTYHLQKAVTMVFGAFFCPVGAFGVLYGCRQRIRWLAAYIAISASFHLCFLISDFVFLTSCDLYPSNMVLLALAPAGILPSPLLPASQTELQGMSSYPAQQVDKIAGAFDVELWYLVGAGSWTLVLIYAACQALLLGEIAERGPLGLGVHYGLGQWDEVLNHDAVLRQKAREMRSQFIEDAKLVNDLDPDIEDPLGWAVLPSSSYGAIGQPSREDLEVEAAFAAAEEAFAAERAKAAMAVEATADSKMKADLERLEREEAEALEAFLEEDPLPPRSLFAEDAAVY
mmetsp:Transcript_81876/g.175427  ORF Transcript_81876/g.175427 Transcript_81876/m.175427 type:complete len:363 (-) Transcript_81876:89-1177(-)